MNIFLCMYCTENHISNRLTIVLRLLFLAEYTLHSNWKGYNVFLEVPEPSENGSSLSLSPS